MTNENRLGTEKIPKLLFSLALPAVTAQVINVLYNIVDRIYIGRIPEIGATALTGVGVTFPILMIISAFSAFVGMGGAPLASIALGRGDRTGAEKILGNCVTVLVGLSVVLTAVFFVFKEPLLYAFGASDALMPYANGYVSIYLCGTLFVQLALGLNTFISAQGAAKTAMASVLIGAILNLILDPVFIFGFDMGVQGAALATIISQAASALWVMRFLLSKKSTLRIRKENLIPNKKIIGNVAALGVSPFIMQSTESLVSITLNSGLQQYGGDLYVGTMTIMMSLLQLIIMPIQGFVQGAQPILSYNYGAKNHDRVKKTFRLMLVVSLGGTVTMFLLMASLPRLFASIFTGDEALLSLTSTWVPVFLGGIWAFGAQMACQTTFLSLGQAKISLFLALLRKIILLIPLAIILPRFLGVGGIYYAEPIADIISATVTTTIFALRIKKILHDPASEGSR
ncbi:MAG: MATE family efflux transporter [Oscillospiraceae bacterium]|nr:MATE family efflux transporter [Oscillospiraceae bacterium]